jgi:hypothetical protein
VYRKRWRIQMTARVTSSMLAMYVRVDGDGLMIIDGGYTTSLWGPEPPFIREVYVVFEVEEDEPMTRRTVEVFVAFGDERTRVAAATVAALESPAVMHLPFVASFAAAGEYRIQLELDGQQVIDRPLTVTFAA